MAFTTAAVIVVPNQKQKDAAALDMFEKPFKQCSPEEAKAAEFKAGHQRWKNFFEHSVSPITRRLPGANNPIVNPYEGAEPAAGGDEDD